MRAAAALHALRHSMVRAYLRFMRLLARHAGESFLFAMGEAGSASAQVGVLAVNGFSRLPGGAARAVARRSHSTCAAVGRHRMYACASAHAPGAGSGSE